jgi:hypothetical protein
MGLNGKKYPPLPKKSGALNLNSVKSRSQLVRNKREEEVGGGGGLKKVHKFV